MSSGTAHESEFRPTRGRVTSVTVTLAFRLIDLSMHPIAACTDQLVSDVDDCYLCHE
jgi:hypothetical protein